MTLHLILQGSIIQISMTSRGSLNKILSGPLSTFFFMIPGIFLAEFLPHSDFHQTFISFVFLSIYLDFINIQILLIFHIVAMISSWVSDWAEYVINTENFWALSFCVSGCPLLKLKFWMIMTFVKIGIWVWTLKVIGSFYLFSVRGKVLTTRRQKCVNDVFTSHKTCVYS